MILGGVGSRSLVCRIYLLYTGQHYDPIVSGKDAGVPVEQEGRRHKKGWVYCDDGIEKAVWTLDFDGFEPPNSMKHLSRR